MTQLVGGYSNFNTRRQNGMYTTNQENQQLQILTEHTKTHIFMEKFQISKLNS